MENQSLEELRAVIDRVDPEIVALLNERFLAVRAIGEYKKIHRLPILDAAREERLLTRLAALNAGPMTPEILTAVYRTIMAGARSLEHTEEAPVYLDNAAAAPVLPEVLYAMREVWQRNFANPEAAHTLGSAMRKKAQAAAQTLFAAFLPQVADAEPTAVFGGGASELIAAIGLALGNRQQTAWGSFRDHPAAQAMLRRAFGQVYTMKIDRFAQQQPLAPTGERVPALGFFTWVQSETGTVLELERLREFRRLFPEAVIVLDAVQGAGKLEYPKAAILPDIMVISGHKFGAPGGGALLFPTRRGRKLTPRFHALREPEYFVNRLEPANVELLALAAGIVGNRQAANRERVSALSQMLRNVFADWTLPNGQRAKLTVPEEFASPYIVHVQLPGYQSGVLVRMLAEKNIMVSAGSACQSETSEPSRILTAMGVKKSDAWSGLRVSLAPENTVGEIQTFLAELAEVLKTY